MLFNKYHAWQKDLDVLKEKLLWGYFILNSKSILCSLVSIYNMVKSIGSLPNNEIFLLFAYLVNVK